jgi:hypothetical protein
VSAPQIWLIVELEASPCGRIVHEDEVCRVAEWAIRHRGAAHAALDAAIDAAAGECTHFVDLDDLRRAA